jgi:hypothetical protein
MLLVQVTSATAQDVSISRRLSNATGTLDHVFGRVNGVRELSDGRLLISDGRRHIILIGDFRSRRVTAVEGRDSTRRIDQPVRALSNDSSAVDDDSTWVLLDGSRLVGEVASPIPPSIRRKGQLLGLTATGDALMMFERTYPTGVSTITRRDSVALVRISRTTASADTVVRLRDSPRRVVAILDARGSGTTIFTRPPFAVGEQAVPFQDGWIAVARLEPYRVDWRGPTGRVVQGAPLPARLLAMSAEDREVIARLNPNKPGRPPAIDFDDWPERLPPFQAFALIAASDGSVLILRTSSPTRPETIYDVVDRRSILVGRMELKEGERVVGVSARCVYVATALSDRTETIARYSWPFAKNGPARARQRRNCASCGPRAKSGHDTPVDPRGIDCRSEVALARQWYRVASSTPRRNTPPSCEAVSQS